MSTGFERAVKSVPQSIQQVQELKSLFHTLGAEVAVLITEAQHLEVLEVFITTLIPQVRTALLFPLYC